MMVYPTFKTLLGRLARRIMLPDFQILDELEGHLPSEEWPVSGHAQIFRESFASPDLKDEAMLRLHANADKALALGVGGCHGAYPAMYRTMSGAQEIERKFGPIAPERWRLAILRPMTIVHVPASEPTLRDLAMASELGVEVVGSPEHWELLIEFGLDVTP